MAKINPKIVKESLKFINVIEYMKINWDLTQFNQKLQYDKTFLGLIETFWPWGTCAYISLLKKCPFIAPKCHF